MTGGFQSIWLWLFAIGLAVGMTRINWRSVWVDPNWRHEISNAVIATVAIGSLGLVLTGAVYSMKIAVKWPLWAFLIASACAGVLVGGIVWLLTHRAAQRVEKQPFVITLSGGSGFATVFAPTLNTHLNNRIVLFAYDFQIVNNLDGATTLKEVVLSYKQKKAKVEVLGMIFPTGTLKGGKSAMMFSVPNSANAFLMNWNDIRVVIGENKERVPGAIWRGSAIFVLGEDVKSIDDIMAPHLVARDYLGNTAQLSISPIGLGFVVRQESFVQGNDGSILWPAVTPP